MSSDYRWFKIKGIYRREMYMNGLVVLWRITLDETSIPSTLTCIFVITLFESCAHFRRSGIEYPGYSPVEHSPSYTFKKASWLAPTSHFWCVAFTFDARLEPVVRSTTVSLSPGKHTIHESYSVVDNPTLGTYSGAIDETYNINVKPWTQSLLSLDSDDLPDNDVVILSPTEYSGVEDRLCIKYSVHLKAGRYFHAANYL
jgi:hypothetical protein